MGGAGERAEREVGRRGSTSDITPSSGVTSELTKVSQGMKGISCMNGGWRSDQRNKKLELPLFDGGGPDGWIFRAERYFSINQMVEEEKLEATTMCLEGEALAWFQWEKKRRKLQSWEDLKLLILERFRPSHEGTLEEKFLALRQEGSVREYWRHFETLAVPLDVVSEAILEGNFINGMRLEIQVKV